MPFTQLRLLSTLVLLSLFSATAVAVSDEAHASDSPRFAQDAGALYQSVAQSTPPSNSDVFVLEDEETIVFDAEGKIVRTRYLLYKVLTQKGAEGWADLSYTWEPWHEERPHLRARVITPDFAVHPLDPATITDSPARDDDDTVFSDRRVMRAPLPAIATGSLVEEEQTARETSVFFGAGSVERFFFGFSAPLRHARLILDAPLSLSLRYAPHLLPDLKPQRTEGEGRMRVVFDVGPLDRFEDPDSDLPSDVPAFPNVVFSTGMSWQSVAERYAQIVDKQIDVDLKPVVARLISGKNSREERAAAILQYLSHEVRYTGVEFGDAAVVPRSPSETLTRKYGDCKDKASLLVALFRAANIPAYVALLNAGSREDVASDLPGMGMFDHAIVYAPGTPDIWIDATDDYARLGQLPASDQDRLALVARPGTTALIRTPLSSSADNILVEKREINLAENGPARIVETSYPHGVIESSYRRTYADKASKSVTKEIESYVKSQYLAEKLDRIDRSDPADLSRQFELVIESKKAKRGITDLNSAAAAIRFDTLFSRLPSDLQQREKPEDAKADSDSAAKPKKKRLDDYQLRDAFVTEWQYSIIPPSGFNPKPLPQNVRRSLGPALLTEEFSANAEGVVHATIRFDSIKRRFTVAEATELRNQVAQVRASEPILIYFEPVGQTLLNQGKVREALQAYRSLVVLHPKEAVHHLQVAAALLGAGLGEPARTEAHLAVQLEPKSALAQKTLAQILEFDRVGRALRPGSDWAGARAALRTAELLDPDDKYTVVILANLLEYDSWGLRYSPAAPLKDAIAEYRKLTPEKRAEFGFSNNLSFALFYAGEFSEAEKDALSVSQPPAALIVACEGALHGSQAAIAEARKRSAGEEQFKQVVKTAGDMLNNVGKYSVAPDLMEAGASGDSASDVAADAATFRRVVPHAQLVFPDDAVGTALRFELMQSDLNLTLDQLRSIASINGKKSIATSDTLDFYLKHERGDVSRKSRTGIFSEVGLDLSMARAQPKVQGDDASGYKVILYPSASYKVCHYIVKEDGKYRVLGSFGYPNRVGGIGLEILDRVAQNNLAGARVLLDWMREDYTVSGGDDPLAGVAFPRIWRKGRDADALAMKLAAASLLVLQKDTSQQGIALLEAGRSATTNESDKVNAALALLSGYAFVEDFNSALAVSNELAKQYPESARAFSRQTFNLAALGRFDDADRVAEERLKRIDGDADALRALASTASHRLDFAAAHKIATRLADEGKASPEDLNEIAWSALFLAKLEPSDADFALKAAQLSHNAPGILHTLGCVYAEIGKTKEAREVLVQAMDALNLDEPDGNYWYAFGRIAEQYGERETALADYARVEKPKFAPDIASSSYRLAQIRMRALEASPAASGNKK